MEISAMVPVDLEPYIFTESLTPRSIHPCHMILPWASFPILTITYIILQYNRIQSSSLFNSHLHQGSNSLIQCPGHYGGMIKGI